MYAREDGEVGDGRDRGKSEKEEEVFQSRELFQLQVR